MNKKKELETGQKIMTAEKKAKEMGLKVLKEIEKPSVSLEQSKPFAKFSKGSNQNSNRSSPKRDDLSDNDDSIGNATIHGGALPKKLNEIRKPSNGKASPKPNERLVMSSSPHVAAVSGSFNTHYNDTMFGDDQNELDSLNYQHHLAANSDDENISQKEDDNEQIEEEINDESADDRLRSSDELGGTQNLKEYLTYTNNNSTGRSDDGVIVGKQGSWDPNDTSKLPKEGNENYAIIEISNFTFNENSAILKRKDINKLFVGMSFLNYDPADLESKNTMPKPRANEPVYFNFRKSNLTI